MGTTVPPSTTPASRPCAHWVAAESRVCTSTDQVRRYLPGYRCPEHTPAALAGRPEPPEVTTPAWWVKDGQPVPVAPLSTSWVHDSRAVASGRRVSGERRRLAHEGEAYDAAQAEVQSIANQYRQQVADLGKALAREMGPYQARLDDLWQQLVDLADPQVDKPVVDLPARPHPLTPPVNESDWLYRSDRHWYEQLQRYKAEKIAARDEAA